MENIIFKFIEEQKNLDDGSFDSFTTQEAHNISMKIVNFIENKILQSAKETNSIEAKNSLIDLSIWLKNF